MTAIIAVIGFVLWLGSSQFNRDFAVYDVVFEGPVTLEEGAAVRYIGIRVGEVESLGIDRRDASKVRARLRVDRMTPVKADSSASIELAGITGLTFVQINAGSDTAGPLRPAPGQSVPVIAAELNPLAELVASGAELAGRTSQTLNQAGRLLRDENIDTVERLLINLNDLTASLAARDEALIAQTTATLQALQRAGDDVAEAARTTTALGAATQTELVSLTFDLKALVAELQGVSNVAETSLLAGQNALQAAEAMIDGPAVSALSDTRLAITRIEQAAARLDRLLRELEDNPQGFVVGRPLPYEESK
ncbi:MAG: MlaD family protein, partial [Pseudomonadota bacterium]